MEAESVEAKAQAKTEREQVVGGTWDNVGSSGSAGASAAGSEEARNNQDMCFENLARRMRKLMSSCSRRQQLLMVSSWQ